jgi:competence protein ComEA
MSPASSEDRSPRAVWLLRRADQAGVAALLLMAFVAMGAWWTAQGGWQGRLVQFDRAEPRAAQFQVDLNTAPWPELAQLPEIGETLARRIVESRQREGPFVDNEELTRVRGIGPKTMERLRPYLRPLSGANENVGLQETR